jgi:hypothetical protein
VSSNPVHGTNSLVFCSHYDRQKNIMIQLLQIDKKTVLFRKSFHHIMIQLLQIDKKQCCSENLFTISWYSFVFYTTLFCEVILYNTITICTTWYGEKIFWTTLFFCLSVEAVSWYGEQIFWTTLFLSICRSCINDTASTDRQKNSVVQKIFWPYHDTASTDRQKTVLFRKSFHHIMIQLLKRFSEQHCFFVYL